MRYIFFAGLYFMAFFLLVSLIVRVLSFCGGKAGSCIKYPAAISVFRVKVRDISGRSECIVNLICDVLGVSVQGRGSVT